MCVCQISPPVRKDTLEPELALRTHTWDSRPEHVAAIQELQPIRGVSIHHGAKPDTLSGYSITPKNKAQPKVDATGKQKITCWHCHQASYQYHDCTGLYMFFRTQCGKQGESEGRCDKCRKGWRARVISVVTRTSPSERQASLATVRDRYSLLGAKGVIDSWPGDERPHLIVNVYGQTLLDLLDPDASHTLIGEEG
ncbi:hypothetical protein AAG570_012460 [Ranatra chinensis]|uniref:Zinc-binding domain-containing protein n=1 Tax=Ranatra chinensis TaxID=642074 RepID=A0ABD0YDY9_9HEMI